MEIVMRIAILILFSSNFLFMLSLAVYVFFDKLGQKQYLVSFSALMTIVFIVTLLIQILMLFLKKTA
jgi:hypothetical protein